MPAFRPARRSAVAPFTVMQVLEAANRRAREGRPVHHLEIGEPGGGPPAAVLEAARAALDRAPLGYSEALGLPALRARLARLYAERYGITVPAERIAVTCGASGAFVLGFLAAFGTFGMVTLVLHGVGIAWQPPDTTSFEGLLLGYLYTNIPLYVLLTLPAMGILRDDWWEAAQVAAATRWTFWRRVGLPVLTPFIAAGWLLIFTWSIGIYALAYALAGTGGADRFPLITLRIGRIIQGDVFTPWRGHVLAVVLMIIAIVALTTYRRLLRRALRWF
mgnify:CR=1 FL=1